jgi:hypothetical protein
LRRLEQEITEPLELERIISSARVCRIAFKGEEYPYVIPVCFGYRDRSVYFHSSKEGKKIDRINADNRVCFELESGIEIIAGESPCKWTVKYTSVIGYGKAHFVNDFEEKIAGLNAIMEHYDPDSERQYNRSIVDITRVIRIDIERMTGKRSRD